MKSFACRAIWLISFLCQVDQEEVPPEFQTVGGGCSPREAEERGLSVSLAGLAVLTKDLAVLGRPVLILVLLPPILWHPDHHAAVLHLPAVRLVLTGGDVSLAGVLLTLPLHAVGDPVT